MTTLGLVLSIVAGALIFVCSVSIYSTTMTFGRSRASRWALVLIAVAFLNGSVGVFLLLH